VRTLTVAACLLALAGRSRAEPPPPTSEARYEEQRKSPALAVTLEAVSPIAGMGALYAHDTDRGWLLAIVSTVAAGAGTGAVLWLVHLGNEPASGTYSPSRFVHDTEEGSAIALLATSAIVYVVARVSGLALASDATEAFNERLRQETGTPPEPVVPLHALAPGAMLSVRF
jgi:hypothetical protein